MLGQEVTTTSRSALNSSYQMDLEPIHNQVYPESSIASTNYNSIVKQNRKPEEGQKRIEPNQPTTPQSIISEADHVVALMRANISTMLERGDSVAKLSEKSEQLHAQAYKFRIQAQNTEKKLWWKNMRMNIAIALFSMLAIGIVISALIKGLPSSSPETVKSIQKSLSKEPFPIATPLSKASIGSDDSFKPIVPK